MVYYKRYHALTMYYIGNQKSQNSNSDVDQCQPNPCLHEGVCIRGETEFTCDCEDTGYTGDTCQNGNLFLSSKVACNMHTIM